MCLTYHHHHVPDDPQNEVGVLLIKQLKNAW